MRSLITAAAILAAALSSPAMAGCSSFGSSTNCYDAQSGNRYSIQEYGNTTIMRGSNPRTGSRWSQRSNTIGGSTYHRGRDAQGNSWRGRTDHNDLYQNNRSNGLTGRGISSCGIAGCD
ncbi:hypothetical protein EQG41_18140 [Billgrantia azerbaijanica]|nr:hypothetical protein EQG41_18140 [Halomonas azerbaijanica]